MINKLLFIIKNIVQAHFSRNVSLSKHSSETGFPLSILLFSLFSDGFRSDMRYMF